MYFIEFIDLSIALTLSDKKVSKTLSLPKLCPLNLRLLGLQKGLKRRKPYQACNGHMLSTQPIREPRPNPSTSLISKSNNYKQVASKFIHLTSFPNCMLNITDYLCILRPWHRMNLHTRYLTLNVLQH